MAETKQDVEKTILNTFSDRLDDLIKEKLHENELDHKFRNIEKLNMGKIADAIGITNATLSRIYNGKCIPDTVTLALIAKYFDVSVDWLMGLSKYRTTNHDLKRACKTLNISEGFASAIYRLTDPEMIELFGDQYWEPANYCGEMMIDQVVPILTSQVVSKHWYEARKKITIAYVKNANVYSINDPESSKRISKAIKSWQDNWKRHNAKWDTEDGKRFISEACNTITKCIMREIEIEYDYTYGAVPEVYNELHEKYRAIDVFSKAYDLIDSNRLDSAMVDEYVREILWDSKMDDFIKFALKGEHTMDDFAKAMFTDIAPARKE